jgi:hypothetical protein
MILIRSQAATFRRNSSKNENSDLNLTSEDEQSSQNLLPQILSLASTKSKSFLKDEMFEINSQLAKAIKISSLNESSDWSLWSKQLKNHLLLIKLWEILSDEKFESSAEDEKRTWNKKQNQLKDLLDLIMRTVSSSLIDRVEDQNVTQQYKILKDEYNKISLSTYA